jgi:glycosyltransferase involved in cell wall biosynthesis
MTRFTVIVTTYQRPSLVIEAVQSVLAQTVPELECIVVDDASPDRPQLPNDDRLRLIRREVNGGTAASRNTGLAAATGSFVTFLDDDDLFTSDRLELVEDALQRNPIVLCWARFLDGPASPGRMLEGDVGDSILDSLVPHVGTTTVRRDLALAFDERLRAGEDVDWWLRMAQTCPVTTVPRHGYLSRRHPGPRHLKEFSDKASSHMRILEWHSEYFASHPSAAAFRWKRVGLLAEKSGDLGAARRAFARSVRYRPHPRTLWHLARSMRG